MFTMSRIVFCLLVSAGHLLFIDENLSIDALEIALFFGASETVLDEVVLALFELFLAGRLAFIPVIGIQLVPEIGQCEIRYHEHACHPDDEFEKGKHSF